MRLFGWIFTALGVCGLVAVVSGATWHWFTMVVCGVMAWVSFSEGRKEMCDG